MRILQVLETALTSIVAKESVKIFQYHSSCNYRWSCGTFCYSK